jgi:hypothetical protein
MMAVALARAGKKAEIVSHQDWRLTTSYVGRIVEEATVAITTMRPPVVIVIGLDESYLMARYEEVYTLPATKGPDGHYHVHGELVVANKEAQVKLLAIMDPIWEATGGIKTIVVGPAIRYLTAGCCEDPDHIPNRKNDNFEARLKSDLVVAKNALKDHLIKAGHSHCRVLDPAMDMLNKDKKDIWGDDPTMPKGEIFDSMVAALSAAEVRIDLGGKRPGGPLKEPVAKKFKMADAGGRAGAKEGTSAATSAPAGPSGGGAKRGTGKKYAGKERGQSGGRGQGQRGYKQPSYGNGSGYGYWQEYDDRSYGGGSSCGGGGGGFWRDLSRGGGGGHGGGRGWGGWRGGYGAPRFGGRARRF